MKTIVGISNYDSSATLYDLVNIKEKTITEAPLSSSAKSLTSSLGTSVIDDSIAGVYYKSNRNSKNIFSEQDAEYMQAVKSGDMETAQRMIKEAAANHVLDIIRSDDEYLEYNYEDYGLKIF